VKVAGKHIVLADHKLATAAALSAPRNLSQCLGTARYDVRSPGLGTRDAILELPRESHAADSSVGHAVLHLGHNVLDCVDLDGATHPKSKALYPDFGWNTCQFVVLHF